MRISDRLKTFREHKKLSQKQLAESIGTALTRISEYERDKVKPSSEILSKLAEIHNLNINWLLTGKGDMFLDETEEKPKIIEKCDEVREAFLKLPPERQRYYYHKIIAESLE